MVLLFIWLCCFVIAKCKFVLVMCASIGAARNQLLPIFQNLDMAKKLCLYVGLPLMSIFQCRQMCRVLSSFKSD